MAVSVVLLYTKGVVKVSSNFSKTKNSDDIRYRKSLKTGDLISRKLRKKVNKLREGGRTVGSGKVDTIIE